MDKLLASSPSSTRSRGRFLVVCALVGSALVSAPALADNVDLETKSAARKLGTEGQKLFDAGDYGAALEKFNLADSLVPAPTLGLRAARCLAKLGRVVEASERYLDVTRMQLDRFAPPVMRKAQADALAEREKLLPSIPSLTVTLDGPVGAGVAVLVDDKPMPAALIGQKRPADPGAHRVEGKRADTSIFREVVLQPSEAAQVVLKLPPLPPPPAKPSAADKFPFRTLGWIGVGLGAAGLAFGGVSGVLSLTNEQSLLKVCGTDRRCPPSAWSQSDTYDLLRSFTTIGVIAGAAGFAVGVPMLLAAPRAPAEPSAPPAGHARRPTRPAAPTIQPYLSWGGAGVRGIF
ncbi:MAG: hypothetical protein ABI193_09530 [Minicystis sp.]